MATNDHLKATDAQAGDKTKPPKLAEPVIQAMHQAVAMHASAADVDRHRHQVGFHWDLVAMLAVAALLIVYVALGLGVLGISAAYAPMTNHLAAAVLLTAVILAGQKLANTVINRETLDDNVTLFNLRLIVRLVAAVLVYLVFLSAISQTWYTVPVVLGMFTVLTGFAVQ